ncbi:MAG: MBL fold metallo-hydrolase [Nitrospirota bacterium]
MFSNSIGDPPSNDTIEITLFGPGRGESILLFIPEIGWGVIDSCEFKQNGWTIVPPLEYLKQYSVQELAFVVLTHLHEDHFMGMEKILSAFKKRIRRVCRYDGDGVRELQTYWAKDTYAGSSVIQRASSLFEVFKEAIKDGAKNLRLGENTILLQEDKVLSNGKRFTAHIQALTPSGESIERYKDLLYRNLSPNKPIVKLPDRDHNLIASALWISVGKLKILLGSDVENGINDQTGWRGVVNNPCVPDLRVHAIKVAHHGSKNAHYAPAWDLHKQKKTISLITPFFMSNPPLPADSDIVRIRRLSRRVGLTTTIKLDRPDKYYTREVTKRIERMTRRWKVKHASKEIGLLRLRYNMDGILVDETAIPPSTWFDGLRRNN